MKKLLAFTALAAMISPIANASVTIHSLVCTGFTGGFGSTTLTFTGSKTLTITETNAFGFPLLSNGDIESVDSKGAEINIYILNKNEGSNLTLSLRKSSSQGELTRDDGESITVSCTGNLDVNN